MKKTKKEEKEVKVEVKGLKKEGPKMRQIIIETDGNNINLVKAEVGGRIELIGILQNLIAHLNQQK